MSRSTSSPSSTASLTTPTKASNSSPGTPSSLFSSTTTTSLLSAVDSILSKSQAVLNRRELTISYQEVRWGIFVSPEERRLIYPYTESFHSFLVSKGHGDDRAKTIGPISAVTLAVSFLEYLLGPSIPNEILQIVLVYFEREFLSDIDIHTHALELEAPQQIIFLKTYYATLKACNSPGYPAKSALFEAAQNGEAHLYAIFGGQGLSNTTCLRDMSYLYSIYSVHLEELIDVASCTLKKLISTPNTTKFFEANGFDIKKWLKQPKSIPSPAYFATAPLSFPIVGLLSLAHFCITCKTIGKHPGEVRDSLRGLSGHSQGIIVAAGIARAGSWAEFYDSVAVVLEILFWIGFESHHATPVSTLSAAESKDSLISGEGPPSPMLGIRGLDLVKLQEFIEKINSHVPENERIHIALVNSRDNMIVSGPPRSLRSLNLQLRKVKADEKADQSRIPYKQRKPIIANRFLPISAPFHSPHLNEAVTRVLKALQPQVFSGRNLGAAVYHTQTGEDIRQKGEGDIMESLIRMVMTDLVDWPKSSSFLNASHILDFGPGRIGMLQHQLTEGTGVRVIIASDLTPVTEGIGSKQEILESSLRPMPQNWGELYSPRCVKGKDGKMKLDTKMSRLFGTPPVMVAGMTPTTVPWDFVATVMNSGYHVELASGGYFDMETFEQALQKISQNIPSNRGVTCNLVYFTFEQLSSLVFAVRQFIQNGLPIDGLTLGARVPPPEIIKEIVETLRLKHISFKPKSYQAIQEVLTIAKAHPDFTIGLQWTGGRSGGHHSFEDFHGPIVKAYGQIRACSNIVLIAGSGFGGVDDTYPYITGEWSESLGYPLMPFDGILLGSRMMISKESHLCSEAKNLIAQAEGVSDDEWCHSFNEAVGGIITVRSEQGQPIHKVATRGVLLWHYLDKKIFNINDQAKRVVELKKNRHDIIDRLNKDFQKPWFAVDWSGRNVELEDMTYLEVLHRLISLMYVRHEQRWINPTYKKFILDFTARTLERLVMLSPFAQGINLQDPYHFLDDFSSCFPSAETMVLQAEDVKYFIELCKRPTQKPINFIPRLDENFEAWFKRDSLWQAEDIEAVINQDIQRICIIHGPVAAQHSKTVDEPCKRILDSITNGLIERLHEDMNSMKCDDLSSMKEKIIIPTQDIDDVAMQDSIGKVLENFLARERLPAQSMDKEYVVKALRVIVKEG